MGLFFVFWVLLAYFRLGMLSQHGNDFTFDRLSALTVSNQTVLARSQASLSSLLRPSSHFQLEANYLWASANHSQLVHSYSLSSLQRPASHFIARIQPYLRTLLKSCKLYSQLLVLANVSPSPGSIPRSTSYFLARSQLSLMYTSYDALRMLALISS